jgi:CheY-like chemotaxis protein
MPYKLENVRLLVVDDMPPMLTLAKSLLNIAGFKDVYTASNGETGFELFKKHSPDLVITDWMMEPVNGLELIDKIRKDPLSPDRYAPVIVMTGYSSRLRVESARDEGTTEFLVKPFTAKDLYSKIEYVIEKPRQFVDAPAFFGPDRRRRRSDNYDGPPRREDDSNKQDHRSYAHNDPKDAEALRKLASEARNNTKL